MRFHRYATLAVLLLCATQANASPAEEKALIDLENRISTAFRDGDVEFVKKSEDETYTLTNSRADVGTRDDDIREVGAREPRYDVFNTHDMSVRVYGDAAVVIGIVSLKGTAGGKPFDANMRFTDTFVRRDGQWRMVAAQVTKIP